MSTAIRKAALDGLYFSGANRLLSPVARGVGAVLMLHRVRPASDAAFQPNLTLEITPEFLAEVIGNLRDDGYEFVSLDEVRRRLVNRQFDSRFVAITLDDGYRDNRIWAQPIFDKHAVPFTIFAASSFAAGSGNLWWLTLEAIIAQNDELRIDDDVLPCDSVEEKAAAFCVAKGLTWRQPDPAEGLAFVQRIAKRHKFDVQALTRDVCMDWNELREVAADPLATIGAHTVSHPILSRLSESEVRDELGRARDVIQQELGREVRHLGYPYGSVDAVGEREFAIAKELGFDTATTTRLGVLKSDDGANLMALPRINVDGRYQRQRYLDVLISGVGPSIWKMASQFRRAA